MRAVDKGSSPYEHIGHYAQALPYLENAIGLYCSYCEFPIAHMPEVEHVSAKSCGGSATDWSNLLLGCKYCNTRKGTAVTPENADNYLWPDTDNTALAFSYDGGVPAVNTAVLTEQDPSLAMLAKASNIYRLLSLDHVPSPSQKDRRFRARNAAYELALTSLRDYEKFTHCSPELKEAFINQTIFTALGSGFFSVWITVFREHPEIAERLVQAFPGTRTEYYL